MFICLYKKLPNGDEEVYYIESAEDLSEAEMGQLHWFVADTHQPEMTQFKSFLQVGTYLEIGPQLGVETPYSSNRGETSFDSGIAFVKRIECSVRYILSPLRDDSMVRVGYLDIMTQEVYLTELVNFGEPVKPKEVQTIPLLTGGEVLLREVSEKLGLGLDDFDVTFTVNLFKKAGRDPTDVELFQIGNSNSDHCRHWTFAGEQIIDGVVQDYSLFGLIKAPHEAKKQSSEGSRSVIAFYDNAGAMIGPEVQLFMPANPGTSSLYEERPHWTHHTITAETHNHPTGISAFPGAATGAGGEIRDDGAVGQGGMVVAGFAGYCTGNLHLPDYSIPGENIGGEKIIGQETPEVVLLSGSDGYSEYVNPFGRPLIGGIMRSFGQMLDGVRYEWRKPILYTAGQGQMLAIHEKKQKPKQGMHIVRFGGPAYKIGVGGGAASSMMHGENDVQLDFNSVQRGNPQMENKANNVILTCIELGVDNPIASIHDSGAGGSGNVLPELVEATGGKISIRKITVADISMSLLEIWSAEYQEGYGALISPENLSCFQSICEREGVNCELVGEVTDDGFITVIDSSNDTTVVHLNLRHILGDLPQKTYESERVIRNLEPLVLPDDLTVGEALEKVWKLPQVSSKGYLVHKADRSVGGKVVQQQCCGPAQIAVSDVAVTADGFFGITGAATAFGEQPIKMLVASASGTRMGLGEAVTNIASAGISSLRDIACRVNCMWAAKLPGEMPRLYDAYFALKDMLIAMGIDVNGGKDSLSMATTISDEAVIGPGQLVIMGCAPVPDIGIVCTPDIKYAGSRLGYVDLGEGKNRLGGSSLAQAHGQIGDDSPDVNVPLLVNAFCAIQEAMKAGLILSLHDRSDGGLITTLGEMCMAGIMGARIDLECVDAIAELFSEELGWVFEYDASKEVVLEEIFARHNVSFVNIGETTEEQEFDIFVNGKSVFSDSVSSLRLKWEETSSRLELRNAEFRHTDTSVILAESECQAVAQRPILNLSFFPQATQYSVENRPKVAILRDRGSNGQREMAAACYAAGLDPQDVSMFDLLTGKVTLDKFQGLVGVGGFSRMDVFGSAKGWAGIIKFNPMLKAQFDAFFARSDTFSLGVCNGCQMLNRLGWMVGQEVTEVQQPFLDHNISGRFESRLVMVKIQKSPAILLRGMEGSLLPVVSAHAEGRFTFPDADVKRSILEQNLVPMVYTDMSGNPTEIYPHNPNGSPGGIAALCSSDGRHLTMMPHPERCFKLWQMPWMSEEWKAELVASPWLRMFQNARSWCDEQNS